MKPYDFCQMVKKTMDNLKEIYDLIDKLEFRKLWYRMRHNWITWDEYVAYVSRLVNEARMLRGNEAYPPAKMEEMWQYRNFGQPTWKREKDELLNGIFGWW